MDIDFIPADQASQHTLLIVGGSGDTKETMTPLAHQLGKTFSRYNRCTCTLPPDGGLKLLDLQTQALAKICRHLLETKNQTRLSIFCTSMGAYSTTQVITDDNFSRVISQVIYFDPADYYRNPTTEDQNHTWSGFQEYHPSKTTIADLLKELNSDLIAHIIHLTIKNHGPDGYISKDPVKRGRGSEEYFPRLNPDMVKTFYTNLPGKNRGQYLNVDHIPHAFMRDGDIKVNIANVSNLVAECLNSQLPTSPEF